jgi:hypothetical protein
LLLEKSIVVDATALYEVALVELPFTSSFETGAVEDPTPRFPVPLMIRLFPAVAMSVACIRAPPNRTLVPTALRPLLAVVNGKALDLKPESSHVDAAPVSPVLINSTLCPAGTVILVFPLMVSGLLDLS